MWVARDLNNDLYLFEKSPSRVEYKIGYDNGPFLRYAVKQDSSFHILWPYVKCGGVKLPNSMFPEVKKNTKRKVKFNNNVLALVD